MKIGFIGLGNMGAPMAANLLKAGHALMVFDLNETAVGGIAAQGAAKAASIAAAVTDVELVITMLPASQHVKAVYLGEGGVLASVKPGVPLVDSSTIDPATVKEVAEAAEAKGNPFADAPVSGGTGGARAGTLTFMVGAKSGLFATVLAQMGKNIVHCGPAGTGQVAKICNNMILGISMIAVSEAMTLGETLGIDPKVLAGVINTSSGRCWSLDTYNPFPGVIEAAPASRGYTGGFAADLMLKDLGLATQAARSVKQSVVLGALAEQFYQAMCGHGGLDFSAVINMYRKEGRR
ncbi:MAG: 3-hydroxyisobutyrate dehydrogenase [Candidatus Protistobacter heckmanni]|nr:3-hydroxyisobutyrate dehydrogenase [Candidatus Protistobacter heckmanni]